jgi:hypothetical protein
MKYSFTTKNNQRVVIDRSLIGGKVKVYIDGKAYGPSHQGTRGATGTFYPIEKGTLEIRSSLWELVPRVWYNEDWVDFVAPLTLPQYLLIALPFFSTVLINFTQILGLIVGALGSLICLVVMHSQRSAMSRLLICVVIVILTPIVSIAGAIAIGMMMGGAQP